MTIAGLIGMAASCSILPILPTTFGMPGYNAPLVVITAGYAASHRACSTSRVTSASSLHYTMGSVCRQIGLAAGDVQRRHEPMSSVSELTVNGSILAVNAHPDQPLLHVLRDELGLTGAKIGCGEGECGACTVLLEDRAVHACVTPVGAVGLCRIRTVEGLEQNGTLHPLQQAFLDQEAFQCGYCTPGMIMSALALLETTLQPTEAEIVEAMQGNICRCGTYGRIVTAIKQAAEQLAGQGAS
jgi:aerobic-type carbon monoxide dehydrogenase small subunit (CoxS/CutS family)